MLWQLRLFANLEEYSNRMTYEAASINHTFRQLLDEQSTVSPTEPDN